MFIEGTGFKAVTAVGAKFQECAAPLERDNSARCDYRHRAPNGATFGKADHAVNGHHSPLSLVTCHFYSALITCHLSLVT